MESKSLVFRVTNLQLCTIADAAIKQAIAGTLYIAVIYPYLFTTFESIKIILLSN